LGILEKLGLEMRWWIDEQFREPATTRVTRASIHVHILLLLENVRSREKSKEKARCQHRRGVPVVGVAVVVYGGHRLWGRRNQCGSASGGAVRGTNPHTLPKK